MKVLIAGGGTGGHVFPGLAIAEEFQERDKDARILFVGTRKGIEAQIIPREGFSIEFIPAEGLMGRGLVNRFMAMVKLGVGILKSFKIVRTFRADVAIGVGGYVSFPLIMAARMLGVKSVIQEQNTVPGITNRILGKWVDKVCVAFEQALCYFPAGKGIVTGNPVRKRLLRHGPGQKDEKFTVLVIGGSQGAHELNQVMIESLDYLDEIKSLLQVIHQTGEKDYPEISPAYQKKGFEAEVLTFISDMERVYSRAHVVICRAGALTLTELMVFHKASILIPFPFAAHRHQELNACELVSKKAARMIMSSDLSGQLLAREIIDLFQNPAAIEEMERRAGELSRPDAAKRILDVCYQLVSGEGVV
jgi:UDP-N-acetylglucosamine--N-acetylmuramyl-(pentapeptide) pyrophosphoryl-undecaprenol N-acetylglucosamine transferase